MYYVQQEDNNIKVLDHKFMTNDAYFHTIEQFSKRKIMYVLQDWYSAIFKSKQKHPYHVKVMTQKEIFSMTNLEKANTRRKQNMMGHSVSCLKIQWLRYVKSEPLKIYSKEKLNDDMEFDIFDITPVKRVSKCLNK